MKIFILVLFVLARFTAVSQTKISAYPNSAVVPPSWLFLLSDPGVTNWNISMAQFKAFLGTNLSFSYSALPYVPQVGSGNLSNVAAGDGSGLTGVNALTAISALGATVATNLTDAANITAGKFANARFYGTHQGVLNQTVLGAGADNVKPGGTALGASANAAGTNGTAVGFNSQTGVGNNESAFGANASAGHVDSTALGTGAQTTKTNQVAIGLANGEVSVPGTLVASSYLNLPVTVGLSNQNSLASSAALDLSAIPGSYAGQLLMTHGSGAGGGGVHQLFTYNSNGGTSNWNGGLQIPGPFIARTRTLTVSDGSGGDGHLFVTSNHNNNVLGIWNEAPGGYSCIDFLSHIGFSDAVISIGWGNTSAVGTNYQGLGYLAMNNSKPFAFTDVTGAPKWGFAGGSTPNAAADTLGDFVRWKSAALNTDPSNVVARITGAGNLTINGTLVANGNNSLIGQASGTSTLLGNNITIGDSSGTVNNGRGAFGKLNLTDGGGSMCNLALDLSHGWQLGRDVAGNFMLGWCLGTVGTNIWVDTATHELILQMSGGPTSFKGTLSGNGGGLSNLAGASIVGGILNRGSAGTLTVGASAGNTAVLAYYGPVTNDQHFFVSLTMNGTGIAAGMGWSNTWSSVYPNNIPPFVRIEPRNATAKQYMDYSAFAFATSTTNGMAMTWGNAPLSASGLQMLFEVFALQ